MGQALSIKSALVFALGLTMFRLSAACASTIDVPTWEAKLRQYAEASQVDWYTLPTLPPAIIRFSEVTHSLLTDESAAKLAEQVKNRPEHPGRGQLAIFNLEKAGKPPATRTALMILNDREWLYASDGIFQSANSVAVRSGKPWALINETLETYPPVQGDAISAMGQIGPYSYSNIFRRPLRELMSRGFVAPRYQVDSVRVQPSGEFEVVMKRTSPNSTQIFIIRINGTITENHIQTTRTSSWKGASDDLQFVSARAFSDYRPAPPLGDWVPHQIFTLDDKGQVTQTLKLESVESITPEQAENYLQIPTPESTATGTRLDLLGNRMIAKITLDPGTNRVTSFDEQGNVVSTQSQNVALARSNNTLWVIIAISIPAAVLVAIAIRRRFF